MRFVNRHPERQRLDGLRGPAFAVVWGRRRVGKTRLLVEWNRERGGLYAVADQSAESIQRRYIAEALSTRISGFADVRYPDWRSLLHALSREAARGGVPGPIILDEIPYLVAACPSLPSVLQNWVDHEAKEAGILLVLAGSSQRMMQGLVLDADAPLYGRAAESFELRPLTAGYIGEALGLRDPAQCVRAYSVWGGIPWYWELAARFGEDLDSAVDSLVLDPAGPLHHEPDRLLLEEQPSAAVLRPLLDAIGAGAHRPTEVAARVGQPTTSLSRPLARLVELHLVRRELPFGESERSSKRALYKMNDPLFRFWFRAVAPNRGTLASAPRATRDAIRKRVGMGLLSETWEELCRAALPRITPEQLGGTGPWGSASRFWRGKGPEWDVVAASLDGGQLLLGEVKWHDGEVSEKQLEGAYQELTRKGTPPLRACEGSQIRHAVFVPKCSARLRRKQRPFLVIDADTVLSALR